MPVPLEYSELFQIFMPFAAQKIEAIRQNETRFVHYTSAAVGRSIIENENVWMRQARCMNDFMEVEYGVDCWNFALESDAGKRFLNILDRHFAGLGQEVIQDFNLFHHNIQNDSYLTCLSEHKPHEDEHGRLSMWRAYGGRNAVALVVNNGPLLSESQALNAFSSPVAYATKDQVEYYLSSIADGIEKREKDFAISDRKNVKTNIFNAFLFGVVCTKHVGFEEEIEWRVIHIPEMYPSPHLRASIETVNGVPQPVYKIPLIELPEEHFEGASIPNFLERVIIGPSEYPGAMRRAFIQLLESKGVSEPEKKVINSGIPLR